MKILFIVALALSSCREAGVTNQKLSGGEQNLPAELKGLKVYNVAMGNGEYVNVAIIGNQITTNYRVGKTNASTIIINNKQNGRVIEVNQILSENDSVIVCRK